MYSYLVASNKDNGFQNFIACLDDWILSYNNLITVASIYSESLLLNGIMLLYSYLGVVMITKTPHLVYINSIVHVRNKICFAPPIMSQGPSQIPSLQQIAFSFNDRRIKHCINQWVSCHLSSHFSTWCEINSITAL